MSNRQYSARVIVSHGEQIIVEDINHNLHPALPRRKLESVICGDHVICEDSGHDKSAIIQILERKSILLRRKNTQQSQLIAANIDQCLIVVALLPLLQTLSLDYYLIACKNLNLEPVIVLNKIDLEQTLPKNLIILKNTLSIYDAIGFRSIWVSAKSGKGIVDLSQQLHGLTSIMVGQSGVGKTSIFNKLNTKENRRVNTVSQATGEGKHTTTETTLYHLDGGGDIIDSPGVRSYQFPINHYAEITCGFPDFAKYIKHCRFHNCRHLNEPVCGVKEAVNKHLIHNKRYQNYLTIMHKMKQTI